MALLSDASWPVTAFVPEQSYAGAEVAGWFPPAFQPEADADTGQTSTLGVPTEDPLSYGTLRVAVTDPGSGTSVLVTENHRAATAEGPVSSPTSS